MIELTTPAPVGRMPASHDCQPQPAVFARKAKSRQKEDCAMTRTTLHRRLPGWLAVFALLCAGMIGSAAPARAAGSISLTSVGSPYTQNFDTLATSGTSSTVPAG